MRKLLEVSWEAWVDSGVDVNELRGSTRVGVYIGCCGSEVILAFVISLPRHDILCLQLIAKYTLFGVIGQNCCQYCPMQRPRIE